MARRAATLPVLPSGLGSPRGGGGGKGGLGRARGAIHTASAWFANTVLALVMGSALAVSGVGEWIGWVASWPVWLVTHGAHLIPGVPLLPLASAMAIALVLMFVTIFCDVVDGTVNQPAVWCLILLGSVGLAAAGVPAEAAAGITSGVNSVTIGPLADFFSG